MCSWCWNNRFCQRAKFCDISPFLSGASFPLTVLPLPSHGMGLCLSSEVKCCGTQWPSASWGCPGLRTAKWPTSRSCRTLTRPGWVGSIRRAAPRSVLLSYVVCSDLRLGSSPPSMQGHGMLWQRRTQKACSYWITSWPTSLSVKTATWMRLLKAGSSSSSELLL